MNTDNALIEEAMIKIQNAINCLGRVKNEQLIEELLDNALEILHTVTTKENK